MSHPSKIQIIDARGLTPQQVADKIREAVGIPPGAPIEIVTPQFDRTPDDPAPTWTPTTREDFDSLPGRTDAELREIGLRPWGDVPEGSGKIVWLYPAEWYEHVPEGYEVVNIFGEREKFKRGVTDDDRRFGVLAFGFQRS